MGAAGRRGCCLTALRRFVLARLGPQVRVLNRTTGTHSDGRRFRGNVNIQKDRQEMG